MRTVDYVFETEKYFVVRVDKGFEVYKIGPTAAGYEGDKGLQRAKLEIERRESMSTEGWMRSS
jgi:hypothetical protein